jgi:uncharacterized protein (TIGR02231 family)
MRIMAAALAAGLFPALASAAEVPAQSKIEAVTVFPSGAEVARTAKVKLEKGEHAVVFQDLPAEAVPGSIRVEGKATGKLDISSVDSRRLFVPRGDAGSAETERRRLEDEVERLRDEKSAYEAQAQAAETQKALIANLAQLPTRPAPAAGDSDRSEDWGQILSVIASGSAGAQRSLLEAQVKIRDLDRKIEDLEKKLTELAPARVERTEVRVYVSAAAPLEADVTVRYQVPNAQWISLYDARLSTGGKSAAPLLDLTRRASISQRTGESWDDVALTLSTTRPAAGASAPQLKPLTVDFEAEYIPRPMAAPAPEGMARSIAGGEPEAAEAMSEKDEAATVKKAKAAVEETAAEVVAAPFQALYAVPGRLSVPNTGEAKRVQLLADAVEPQLTVKTVPKADAKAYLYAKLVLPKTSTPLLPGAVSLFRDGTFVGTDHIPVLSPGEEHELGFGIDDLVRVKHAISEEKRGETGLISTSKTDVRNYRITVKNMHERAVQLVIFDQVPVSQNQDIRVELLSKMAPSKQNVDDRRGVLSWEQKLEPDQEQVLEFGYRVTWPSGKTVVYR